MAKKPGKVENLNPVRTKEEAKERGRRGGIRSGEVRREKKDAKACVQMLLNLKAKGSIKDNLEKLGVDKTDQTNMTALVARLFAQAMSGNLEAGKRLLVLGGYDCEENRTERESIASDKRRDAEVEAKIKALGGEYNAALNLQNDDENTDVVIYLPEKESIEDCTVKEENKGE